MKQGYIVAFSKPNLPSFFFEDPPYSFAWVKDFASGISSAVRKDFEIPEENHTNARVRGERMGNMLKLFSSKWGFNECDFRAITITWVRADGSRAKKFFEKLEIA